MRGGGGRVARLILLLCGGPCDAAAPPLPWPFGLGEGLLVCVLLGMHLLVQEVTGQLVPVVDLQLHTDKEM